MGLNTILYTYNSKHRNVAVNIDHMSNYNEENYSYTDLNGLIIIYSFDVKTCMELFPLLRVVVCLSMVEVKQSRYTPWRHLGGEEI
jgi:hypothetical protein